MKFNQFISVVVVLGVLAGCAREAAVERPIEQPLGETASPSASAEAVAPTASVTSTSTPTSSLAEKSGTFVAGEAPTAGTAQIVTENGDRYLELDQTFKTSDRGPDLFVILHRSDDVLGSTEPPAYPLQEGDYVILGPLEKFSGTQRYSIPADVNLDDYKSAVIWCRQFNATFGVAEFDS